MLMKSALIALALTSLAAPAMAQAPTTQDPSAQAPSTQAPSAQARAKDEIWALEKAIYAGRASGDMTAYVQHTATGYLSWPPTSVLPMGQAKLEAGAAAMHKTSKELLDMQFVDFSLHGDTAVIYYKTHRTRRADGTVVDDHFQTTHTWVREGGQWRVFAGMARQVDKPKP
jgi:ketosteroid isomerase-like protein